MFPSNLHKITNSVNLSTLLLDSVPNAVRHNKAASHNYYQKLATSLADFHSSRDNIKIVPDQVIISSSRKQLLFNILMTLQVYEIYLVSPTNPIYMSQLKLLRHKYKIVHTRYFDNWKLNQNNIHKLKKTTAKPGILVLNLANYPVGLAYSQEELNTLVTCLRESSIYLLQDESDSYAPYLPNTSSAMGSYSDMTILISCIPSIGVSYAIFPKSMTKQSELVGNLSSITQDAIPYNLLHQSHHMLTNLQDYSPQWEQLRIASTKIGQYITNKLVPKHIRVYAPQDCFCCLLDFCNYSYTLQNMDIRSGRDLSAKIHEDINITSLPGVDWMQLPEILSIIINYVDAFQPTNQFDPNLSVNAYANKHAPELAKIITTLENWLTTIGVQS